MSQQQPLVIVGAGPVGLGGGALQLLLPGSSLEPREVFFIDEETITPVEVNDFPGFVSNRVLMPMINEACWALMQGVGGLAVNEWWMPAATGALFLLPFLASVWLLERLPRPAPEDAGGGDDDRP